MKKIVKIIIIFICAAFIITGCNKNENVNDKSNKDVKKEPNNTVLKKGVIYADSSRNIDNVKEDEFSFFLDDKHKTILSYKNNDEIQDIRLRSILNYEKHSGAIFDYNKNGAHADICYSANLAIAVSTKDYTDAYGNPFMTSSKTLLNEDNNNKLYMEKIDNYLPRFEYVTKIDGIEVHFYSSTLERNQEYLIKGINKLSKLLSKDKGYGFYIDWYMNSTLPNQDGFSFKTYDTIKVYKRCGGFLSGGSVIELAGHKIEYFPNYSGDRNNEIKENFVKLFDLNDNTHIGYEILEEKDLYIYLYHSKVNDEGKTIKVFSEDLLRIQDYKGSTEEIENIAKAYKDSLITVEKKF